MKNGGRKEVIQCASSTTISYIYHLVSHYIHFRKCRLCDFLSSCLLCPSIIIQNTFWVRTDTSVQVVQINNGAVFFKHFDCDQMKCWQKKAIRFPPGKVVSKRYFLLSFLKQQQQKNHWNIFLLPKQFSIKTEVLLKVEQVTQVKDETIKHFKIAETNNDCYVSFFQWS